MSERRFNDQEVAKILESALSENMDRALPARTSEGMTLAELQDIAREVGIDPVGVERAALALSEPAGRRSPMLGAPTTVQHERTVEGEVSQEHMQELVTTIRRVMARQGVVSVELDSLEWRARDALGARYVSITPGKGRTLIRALGNFRDGVAALFGGGTVLGFLSLAFLKASGLLSILGFWAAPVVAAAAFFPARFVWRRKARQEEDDLRAVVARLAEQLAGEFERPPHGGADD
jgi:hypothetical protein